MPALKTTITAREIGKAIAKAIHEHKVLPGTKLGEDELSEIYGVSRTLVRSALQGLSHEQLVDCLLYTSPSPRDRTRSRMPSSA